jgi:hypothetical protein
VPWNTLRSALRIAVTRDTTLLMCTPPAELRGADAAVVLARLRGEGHDDAGVGPRSLGRGREESMVSLHFIHAAVDAERAVLDSLSERMASGMTGVVLAKRGDVPSL